MDGSQLETTVVQAHAEIPTVPDALARTGSEAMSVSHEMVILTWLAFIVAAVVLKKVLWKPLLALIENRETSIQSALSDAEKARRDVASAGDTGKKILADAEAQARNLAEQASRGAQARAKQAEADAGKYLEEKRADALRVIEADRMQAEEALRVDAAKQLGHALELLLPELLTDEQKQAYQQRMLAEVRL